MKPAVLSIAFLAALLFVGAGCDSPEWTGFYYPDSNNIENETTVVQPGLHSLEECQNWVGGIVGKNHNYDYQCGRSCRYEKAYGQTICKEKAK